MITLVLLLDEAPDWDRFVDRLRRTAVSEPRLSQRLVHPWTGFGPPEWAVDPDFDILRHVGRSTLAGAGGLRQLLELVESWGDLALDPSRPLWQATLVDGATIGAALVARMSHVLTDGLAGMQLLAGLVDSGVGEAAAGPDDASTAAVPGTAATRSARPLTGARLSAERMVRGPARLQLAGWRNSIGLMRATSDVLSDPKARVGQAASYARSLSRMVLPTTTASSPAMRERSNHRRYLLLEVSALELRRAARRAGGSLNDGYLAAVVGGLRRYHEAHGLQVDEVPFAIPVSTRGRRSDDASGDAGNRFAAVRFAAPTGIVDPTERIRRITETVKSARAEPALDALTTFAPALAALPARLLGLAGLVQDHLDMQASYVPGPPVPVRLVGSTVTSMFAFGPLPGPAAMSVLLTYVGVARIGFTVDSAAIADLDVFEQAMTEGFAEVLALAEPVDRRTPTDQVT